MGGHEGHRTAARLTEGQYNYFIEIGPNQNRLSIALNVQKFRSWIYHKRYKVLWVDIVFQSSGGLAVPVLGFSSYLSASPKTSNDYFHCSRMFIVLHRMFIFSTKKS